MQRKIKPVSPEHTDEHGVRRILGDDGESWMRLEDLARFLLSIELEYVNNAEKRAAIARFQREAAILQPAAQHRRALALLEEMGCSNIGSLQLKPKAVG
jgi:hypothetical protein